MGAPTDKNARTDSDNPDVDAGRVRSFSAPSLRGRHVHLRIVVPDDYTYLQLVETSGELAPRWRLRGSTPSPQDWVQGSWSGVLAQFMIVANRDQTRVGLVTAFQANFQDGHARLAATRFDPHSRSPLMVLGFGLFVEYVFRCWNLRKLYLDVPEYNYAQLASARDRIFTLEGRLRDHYYFDGQYWDQLLLAIYREMWRDTGQALVRVERAT